MFVAKMVLFLRGVKTLAFYMISVFVMSISTLVCVPLASDLPCFCSLPSVDAGVILPRTGQITEYAVGDDGDVETGVQWPVPRFTDNNDGTIRDNLTGLEWLKKLDCLNHPFSSSNGDRTWQKAFNIIDDFNNDPGSFSCSGYTANRSDWRMPNRNELSSLFDRSQYDPALPTGHPFANVGLNWSRYWTSTTFEQMPDRAFAVNIVSGNEVLASKTLTSLVLPVRAGIDGELFKLGSTGPEPTPACDDRVAIDNPVRNPFYGICCLRYDKEHDGSPGATGSGALVGPHMVLTAGHCVYMRKKGRYNLASIHVQPGAHIDNSTTGSVIYPFGERIVRDVEYKKTNASFINAADRDTKKYDYGALLIVCPFEEITTHMPLCFNYGNELESVNMSGYPVKFLPDASRTHDQWRVSGEVERWKSRYMIYGARSTGGASGSPVWEFDGTTRSIVAVNVSHSTNCNGIGTRLVSNNENLIRKWMQWKPTLAEREEHGCDTHAVPEPLPFSELLKFYSNDNTNLLLDSELLGLIPVPEQPASLPDRRIFQFIENNFYEWEEFLVETNTDGDVNKIDPADPEILRYLHMIEPIERWLSVDEAQVLLTASASWIEHVLPPPGNNASSGAIGTIEAIEMPVFEDDDLEDDPDDTDDTPDEEASVISPDPIPTPLPDNPIASLKFRRRAAQLLEELRNSEIAPAWGKAARLMPRPVAFLRPDVEGAAYHEFRVWPSGYIMVSAGEHDYPVCKWSDTAPPPSLVLKRLARKAGEKVTKHYKVDSQFYVAENDHGHKVASIGDQPLKVSGMQLSWLDKEVDVTTITVVPDIATNSDENMTNVNHIKTVTGTIEDASIDVAGWDSWRDLKDGYKDFYDVLIENLRRNASVDWDVNSLAEEHGEGIEVGDKYTLAILFDSFDIEIEGEGEKYASIDLVKSGRFPPRLIIEAVEPPPNGSADMTIAFSYFGGRLRERINISIVDPDIVNNLVQDELAISRAVPNGMRVMSTSSWSNWTSYWANGGSFENGSHAEGNDVGYNDQRQYDQFTHGSCAVGCGPVAWAMLFGWADHQAHIDDSYWEPRSGLYPGDAPQAQDGNIDAWIRELHDLCGTWCAGNQGATSPWKMDGAFDWFGGRTGTTGGIVYNPTFLPMDTIRVSARNSIRDRNSPVIIGAGFAEHYPLAYGYKWKRRTVHTGTIWERTEYSRKFKVNQGHGGSSGEWIPADTWFAGYITP